MAKRPGGGGEEAREGDTVLCRFHCKKEWGNVRPIYLSGSVVKGDRKTTKKGEGREKKYES